MKWGGHGKGTSPELEPPGYGTLHLGEGRIKDKKKTVGTGGGG